MAKKLKIPNQNAFDGVPALKNACHIMSSSHTAVGYFHQIYKILRKGEKGNPLERDQDVLRAMLLFAAAGLDAVIKQLVKDSLEIVISKNEGAKKIFKDHIERRVKRPEVLNGDDDVVNINTKLLAEVLASNNPQKLLIADMIKKLTDDSLQSADQLLKVAACFAIPKERIITDLELVRKIFDVRNKITHEMDINLSNKYRKRWPRREADMIKYTDTLMKITALFMEAVKERL